MVASRKRSFAEVDGENGDPLPASPLSVRGWPYKDQESCVLIGIRGSGKSSLAFLAATAYDKRLIDIQRAFFEHTGLSLAEHRKTAGIEEHHKCHQQVLRDVLAQQGCVIVLNFSELEHGGHAILQEYAKKHPVIHITRDVKGIQSYMKVWTEEKTSHLLSISGPLLRSCSNFEYFNSTENSQSILPINAEVDDDAGIASGQKSPAPSLTLKRVERDFLKFLRQILGGYSRKPSHQSAYPLSQIAVEKRRHTYATIAEATHILAGDVDLEDLQIGADALQIVFDMAAGEQIFDPHVMGEVFSTVRRSTILPLILDVFPPESMPSNETRKRYKRHIEQCLRFAPEYIILQAGWLDDTLIRRQNWDGDIRAIGRHIIPGWNEAADQILSKSGSSDLSIIQLLSEGEHSSENLALEVFKERQGIPDAVAGPAISAYNYGRCGWGSQYLNQILAPVLPRGVSLQSGHPGMPGITAQQATQALFASFVLDPLRFYIFGADVSYSLSPAMHNAAYKACGMPHTYTACSVASLDKIGGLLKDVNFGGTAITQPYKIEVIRTLDSLSRHAKFIGAVNTVVPVRAPSYSTPSDIDIANTRNRAGPVLSLHGGNTDWIGIRACIRRGLSPVNTVRPSSCGLVIGAGGMGRAAIYAMIHIGVENIFIHNRTHERAVSLADYFNGLEELRDEAGDEKSDGHDEDNNTRTAKTNTKQKYTVHVIGALSDAWPAGFRQPTMIVCSVPAQTPDGETSTDFALPAHWLQSPSGGIVLELAYKPLVTPLVRQMRAEAHRGWIIMHGLDMLPEQAFAQFELFTGRRAPRRLMRDQVLERFREEQRRG
ncbi:hypothetical protein MBLNU459_g7585t1 [Dothideomycetes sp. NU459]